MQTFRFLFLSIATPCMLMSFISLPIESPQHPSGQVKMITSAKASWVKDTHDFGEIPRGTPVSVEFAFTNAGDAALIIKDVVTSCGCTASDYSQAPIMPGKTSTIKVTYNAANVGAFSKSITVNSNDQEKSKVLLIKGVVK